MKIHGFTSMALSTVQALTPPTGATRADIAVEGTVRYRVDGTDPTASVGMRLIDGAIITMAEAEMRAAKFIAATAGASISVTYYS